MEQLLAYAQHLGANSEVLHWLQTTGTKSLKGAKITVSEMEHVLDYLCSDKAPQRLQKMSIVDAKRKAKEWSAATQKKGRNLQDSSEDISIIHDFLDGTRIVQLHTADALKREGFLMAHCVGNYQLSKDRQIYSYRDAKNMPHATFEVQRQANEIMQIKGKGNGPIHPKYIHPILTFLQSIGMNIRPYDMQNLGYYHIPKKHLALIEQYYPSTKDQIVHISGEAYAF